MLWLLQKLAAARPEVGDCCPIIMGAHTLYLLPAFAIPILQAVIETLQKQTPIISAGKRSDGEEAPAAAKKRKVSFLSKVTC